LAHLARSLSSAKFKVDKPSTIAYLEVIQDGEKKEEDTVTANEKHLIRQKSQLLCLSLPLALEHMNKWTWNQCCREAIEMAKKMGVTAAKNSKTIEKWYRNFREKGKFCIPLKAKHNLPPFLELNPDVCRAMKG
jgi:tRNA U55 pseudouridine synthase TruB